MDDVAIRVDHVSKVFKLPHERTTSVKGLVVNFYKRNRSFEQQRALNDISFEVKKGDFFGIVGRNGSGKSTLLKMLAGIYAPTQGTIFVDGKLTPFIELGVGFNPELTGRENVFLNGALLGFSRKQMQSMYHDIVEFAELKKFMDQKLKNYSSGMQVRLAFSIAIRANTDILVLDEVLAVGDEAFQKKCFSYFDQLKRKKKTVVLVTHDMAAVERYCNRAIFIENGDIQKIGDPYLVAAAYSRSNDEAYQPVPEVIDTEQKSEEETAVVSDINLEISDTQGNKKKKFIHGETMRVTMTWTKPGVQSAGIAVIRQSGEYVFGPNTYQDKWTLNKPNSLEYDLVLNLGAGDYFLKAGIFGKNDNDVIDFEEQGPGFTVNRDKDDSRWGGITKLPYKWR